MRSVLRKLMRRIACGVAVALIAGVGLVGLQFVTSFNGLIGLFALLVIGFLGWMDFRGFAGTRGTYVNKWGYIVLRENNELEHRFIAGQLLGRDLASNEVVHHINGRKVDNDVRNLCLMNREKHEHFHSWLKWKKEKSGRYPSIAIQKRVLVNEYGGVLLEDVASRKRA